jgi:hypothetical protein
MTRYPGGYFARGPDFAGRGRGTERTGMQRSLRVEGEVVDQQTYLDGTREFTVEASGPPDADAPWQVTLTFRWPKEEGGPDEGDLTLTDAAGASLYGTLTGGSTEDAYDEDTASEVVRLALDFELRSGDGAFAGYSGSARVSGDLAGERVELAVEVSAEPGQR